MRKDKGQNRISQFFRQLYIKLFKINDTPQRIALGLGLGVFSGIIPGTGPLAALFLAMLFRVNRAASLLGSLLTNTWLSIVTFLLSIKLGSAIMKNDWQAVEQDWIAFLNGFRWLDLFKLSALKVILPVIIGYLVIAFCLGFLAYLVTLIIIAKVKHENKSGINLSR